MEFEQELLRLPELNFDFVSEIVVGVCWGLRLLGCTKEMFAEELKHTPHHDIDEAVLHIIDRETQKYVHSRSSVAETLV